MQSDRLEYTKRGLRELKAVPKPERIKIMEALEHLRIGVMNVDKKPLTGHPGYHRLRCGNWRIIYKQGKDLEMLTQVFSVVKVIDRKDLTKAVRQLEAA
jgi:mRNA-degrading endonuclease RelE of RelBE toxin-antitoxin system